MKINNLETDRLIIRSTKKKDTSFCLDIWLDYEMGKYLCDPPKEKADASYLKWKDNVERVGGQIKLPTNEFDENPIYDVKMVI